jgi:hypothetical protein
MGLLRWLAETPLGQWWVHLRRNREQIIASRKHFVERAERASERVERAARAQSDHAERTMRTVRAALRQLEEFEHARGRTHHDVG